MKINIDLDIKRILILIEDNDTLDEWGDRGEKTHPSFPLSTHTHTHTLKLEWCGNKLYIWQGGSRRL